MTATFGSNHASVPKVYTQHTHAHSHTEPFPTLDSHSGKQQGLHINLSDGDFTLAGKQWRAKAKTTGSGGKVPAEGCLCSSRSSQGRGAETASCKVAGVSSAASTQIFTHKQHITQQLPFVSRNGSGSNNKRESRETGSQTHTQPQPELGQDVFPQLARELIENGQEPGLAPEKLLLPAWKSSLRL